jgi:hypothetical protein
VQTVRDLQDDKPQMPMSASVSAIKFWGAL